MVRNDQIQVKTKVQKWRVYKRVAPYGNRPLRAYCKGHRSAEAVKPRMGRHLRLFHKLPLACANSGPLSFSSSQLNGLHGCYNYLFYPLVSNITIILFINAFIGGGGGGSAVVFDNAAVTVSE